MANVLDFDFLSPIKSLPEGRFNQTQGTFSEENGCCFGAHLSSVLGEYIESPLKDWDYIAGKKAFMKRLNINQFESALLFKKAGLKVNPWGEYMWNKPPSEIIENLEDIAVVPKIRSGNFIGCSFEFETFKGHSFYNANFQGAEFKSCLFEDFVFKRCNLLGADFQSCVFIRTNFIDSALKFCAITGSNLKDCNFQGSNLDDANIRGCELDKTQLKGTYGKPVLFKNVDTT